MSTQTTTLPGLGPSEFILPDLFSDCHFPLRQNPHCDEASRASQEWFLKVVRLAEPTLTRFMGLQASEYTANSYPDADAFHLRVCSDWYFWGFSFDDQTDEFDGNGVREMHEECMSIFRDPVNFQTKNLSGMLCKSFFSRFKQTAGPGCTKRFIHAMDSFFIAVAKQADERTKEHLPDLESYIALRRYTSGARMCFALIEFATQIDLPDVVASHPAIMAMEQAANDYASWCNDLFSYNKEQSCGDMHNMVAVLMSYKGLDLQAAIDHAGRLCNSCIQRFEDNRAILPSWGEEIDRQAATYVKGLQDCMVGNLHWSFNTTRYFGNDGPVVKKDRVVKLLPKTPL